MYMHIHTLGYVAGSQCTSAWTGHRKAQLQSQKEAYTARSHMLEDHLVQATEDVYMYRKQSSTSTFNKYQLWCGLHPPCLYHLSTHCVLQRRITTGLSISSTCLALSLHPRHLHTDAHGMVSTDNPYIVGLWSPQCL